VGIEKSTLAKLERFATAFREARERGANESDTVMYLVKFFEELGGYDSLKGEISKELAIKDRYCDLALKIGGSVRLLVECKAAGIKGLVEKHIEQAENYASRAGLTWVLLTNGIEWKLFHLSFAEGEGISHDLAFEANLLDELTTNPEGLWAKLGLLTRDALEAEEIEDYWSERKALSPASVVRALFSQDVLIGIRRELNRKAAARLDIEDVFDAVREILSKEAILDAGEITVTKRRRKRRAKKAETPAEEKIADAAGDVQVIAPMAGEVVANLTTQAQ
jgi:predicted type IV restriction endonuclease